MLVVCLPTYNERGNLAPLVSALDAEIVRLDETARILVVDDASPDGTGQLADELQAENPRLQVLHRNRKEGIGPAYLAAFESALALGADLVVQMDCDFSHSPGDVSRLVRETSRADLVIGSRYANGGAIHDWKRTRRAVSRAGCAYARALLAAPIRDLTSGFKCFRRPVLESIDFDLVESRGYVFQIEMTYRALLAGFRVREVPIVFYERTVGQSKMTKSIVAEALFRVPELRLTRARGRRQGGV